MPAIINPHPKTAPITNNAILANIDFYFYFTNKKITKTTTANI